MNVIVNNCTKKKIFFVVNENKYAIKPNDRCSFFHETKDFDFKIVSAKRSNFLLLLIVMFLGDYLNIKADIFCGIQGHIKSETEDMSFRVTECKAQCYRNVFYNSFNVCSDSESCIEDQHFVQDKKGLIVKHIIAVFLIMFIPLVPYIALIICDIYSKMICSVAIISWILLTWYRLILSCQLLSFYKTKAVNELLKTKFKFFCVD